MVALTSSIRHFVQWLVFLLLTVVVSFSISWFMWAKVDFAYPLIHKYAGLAENIDKYAPRNPVKPHFDQTTPKERARLFHGILKGIHHHGQGLAELRYHDSRGQPISTLLTKAEIIHLQDVARLLDRTKVVASISFILWVVAFATLLHFRQPLPDKRKLLIGLLGFGLVIAMVLSLGAVEVFYQLHEWIFPKDHQWFFYYEESLMSMMMKAPDLFGYIAVMLLFSAIIINICLLWVYKRVVRKGQDIEDPDLHA